MQHSNHSRMQQLLLISKLLDGRDNASPFTLVIDSLEQSAKPLLRHCVARAKTSLTRTIFISFETLRPPPGTSHFIPAWSLSLSSLRDQIESLTSPSTASSTQTQPPKYLLIFDTLHPLFTPPPLTAQTPATNPATYLSSLLTPTTHLLGIYHTSVPLPPSQTHNPYAPTPLTLLRHLSTTLLTLHSLHHTLSARAASHRSLAPPPHGLHEDTDGVIAGLGANDPRGIVVECEMRRRSGRGVGLWFVLDPVADGRARAQGRDRGDGKFGGITLLDEHPLFRLLEGGGEGEREENGGVSFDMGLTEKQKRDREGVVLPYFDAQTMGDRGGGGAGVGGGGRILYDMGSEDDFDDEEDEI